MLGIGRLLAQKPYLNAVKMSPVFVAKIQGDEPVLTNRIGFLGGSPSSITLFAPIDERA
jgi:hypothetical protein